MNHNLKIDKSIQYAGIIILVLVFVFASVAAIAPVNAEKSVSASAILSYEAAQANPALSDEEKIKSAIDAYFITRYEGQKLLQTQDFSALVDDNTQPWVKKEQDKRDIELYIAKLFDLKYVSYKYTLDYNSITIDKNQATVELSESHTVVFKAIAPAVSEMANLLHTITLYQRNGSWQINKDEYQDELSQEMAHMTKADILKQVDINYQEYVKQKSLSSSVGKIALTLVPPGLLPLTSQHPFSGSAAAIYADNHVPHNGCGLGCTYNTTWYKTESNDDCTNYVSQALYAGEGKTPPDTSGMAGSGRSYYYDWYYVFNNPPGTQNGSGSLPWIRVQSQYDFLTGSTSRIGPHGVAGSFGNTHIGDVVQLYNVNGDSIWDHEGIIIATGLSYSTEIVDAHTTDRWHYPLSYWASYQMRFILLYSTWTGS